MDAPLLTDDFKEFLRLLNASRVEYLLVGGARVDVTLRALRVRAALVVRVPGRLTAALPPAAGR